LGLHLVGDAAATTNPIYSRGCTLALVHAWALADVLVQHAHDAEAQVLAMDGVMTGELQAWFHDAIQQDRDRLAAWRPGWTPTGVEASVTGQPADWSRMAAVHRASTADIHVWRKYTRAQNLLISPRTLFTDPDVRRRTEAVQRSGFRPPKAAAPDHDELVELATDASQAGAPVTAG
jgi:flavin-dependent dehydrogenase